MARLARTLVLLAVLVGVAAASAAAARSPRLEQLALTAADNAKAKKGTIALADLGSGWKGGPKAPNTTSAPDCAGKDFSRFTLTGVSQTAFTNAGTTLTSLVQVFPSDAQALGDFRVDTGGDTAQCEGAALTKAYGPTAKLLSAKKVKAPAVGSVAAEFTIAVKVGANTAYFDVIEFVRGRTIGGLFTLNSGRQLAGLGAVARLMDERLQTNVA